MNRILCVFALMFTVTVGAKDVVDRKVISPECAKDNVIISDGFVKWCVDSTELDGSRLLAGSTPMIIWSETKHLSISTHTSDSWGDSDYNMSVVPEVLVSGDFKKIANSNLRDAIVTIRNIIDRDTSDKPVGVATVHGFNVSYFYGDKLTYIFVSHPKNTHYFTQISVYGMTQEQVFNIFVKGIIK